MYGRSRFSPGFARWARGDFNGYSYGTGTTMMVSPIGYLFDSIRKAISIGGDSDIIASMDGTLSEIYFGVDEYFIIDIRPYLKDYMYDLHYNNVLIYKYK